MARLPELPIEVIVHIMRLTEFPVRHTAAQVCRKWRDASVDPCFTLRVEPKKDAIKHALRRSLPGGTIILAPGYYQETVIACTPVRIIGESGLTLQGESRISAVIEGLNSIAVICRAHCQLKNVMIRTRHSRRGRSMITFHHGTSTGPVLQLVGCEVWGGGGLHLPHLQPSPKLLLQGCRIHSSRCQDYAVHIGGGGACITACTITGNRGAGVGVAKGAHAVISNCDISFNGRAGVYIAGSAKLVENVIWGNRGGPIEIDPTHEETDQACAGMLLGRNHVRARHPLTPTERVVNRSLERDALRLNFEAPVVEGAAGSDVEAPFERMVAEGRGAVRGPAEHPNAARALPHPRAHPALGHLPAPPEDDRDNPEDNDDDDMSDGDSNPDSNSDVDGDNVGDEVDPQALVLHQREALVERPASPHRRAPIRGGRAREQGQGRGQRNDAELLAHPLMN